MLRKWTIVAVLVLIAIMAFSVTAFAQTEPGAGPDNPLTPDGTWTKLLENGEHWYLFTEEGDKESVEVKMEMVPNGGVAFEVWDQESLKAWADEEEVIPVGEGTLSCGCSPADETGKFNWHGSFTESGDYYIVVKNQNDDTSYYTLDVIGKEVSFPQPMAEAPTVEAAKAVAPAIVEEPVAQVMPSGESPFYAMPISQEWTDLGLNQEHWYEFTYDFDTLHDPIEVRVYSDPPQAAVVTIRDENQARLWVQDGTDQHFGCCTDLKIDNAVFDNEDEDFDVDKDYGDEQVTAPYMGWASDELASGHYYIVVSPATGLDADISYRLEVTGDGISSALAAASLSDESVALVPAAVPMAEPVAMTAVDGESPALALPLTEEWMTLEEGQYQWFAFTYDYDTLNDPLEVRVYADPEQSAVVTVRNAHQALLWEQDGTHQHFGCCTDFQMDNAGFNDEGEDFDKDKDYGDEMVTAPYMRWTSDELASGQYYIVVGLAEGLEGPATYRIEVLGNGVAS